MSRRSRKAGACLLIMIGGALSASCGDEFTFRLVLERSVEGVFWQSVEDSTSPAGLTAYLERWPDGQYAPQARRRLLSLDGPTAFAADPVSGEPDGPLMIGPVPLEGSAAFTEPGTTFWDCVGCPEMVVLPSGTFRMGSTAGQADEQPVREVRVETFALSRHEVTRGEFGVFAAATGYAGVGCAVISDDGSLDWDERASWRNPDFQQGNRQPVVCVSWDTAEAYVRWLSAETGERYRLPSEAEWEYGARAGTVTTRYWEPRFGGICEHANGSDRTLMQRWRSWPMPVVNCVDGAPHTWVGGAYEPNAFGLHDMLGNVWEWTADCLHESYRGAPSDGSVWTDGGDCGRRVLRGGSWETPLTGIRAANRYWHDNRGSNTTGFRVARNLR